METKRTYDQLNKMFLLVAFLLFACLPNFSYGAITSCDSIETTPARLTCEWGSFIELSVSFGYLIGSLLLVWGSFMVYLHSKNPGKYGTGNILSAFIAATLFLGFGEVVTLYQSTVFGESDVYALTEYNSSVQRIKGIQKGGGLQYFSSETMQAILGFVKFVGIIAMLRSIYLVYVVGKGDRRGDSEYWQILVLALGGALAFRIEDVTCLLGEFFGIASICFL